MGLWDKITNIMNVNDDEYEEEVEETVAEEQPAQLKRSEPSPRREPVRAAEARRGSKTVAFSSGDNMQLVLVKPERFEDVTGIADQYCAKKTVVLNLERADRDLSRRIIDFLSGVAYAKNGSISKAANNTFVIAPCDVDVSGDTMFDEETGVY